MKEITVKSKYNTPMVEVISVRVEAGMTNSGSNIPEDASNASTTQLGSERWS